MDVDTHAKYGVFSEIHKNKRKASKNIISVYIEKIITMVLTTNL